MSTAGLPTFQETFANCPFPEGVLAVLGNCPVQVRVNRAERAMDVELLGKTGAGEVLELAAGCIKEALGLNRVAIMELKPAPDAQAVQMREKKTAPDLNAQLEAMQKKIMWAD